MREKRRITSEKKWRIASEKDCDLPLFSHVICRFSLMRFASLFSRMPSERSGKSHERKAANHIREKWRIAIFRCDSSLYPRAKTTHERKSATNISETLWPQTDSGAGKSPTENALKRQGIRERK
jgi:hypothetical protein